MIESLHISNYALIREIMLEPSAGLNIITGETGAGKSIIMGALSLLQGRRADLSVVKDPSQKSVVECVFAIDAATEARLAPILTQADAPFCEGHCVLRREILPSGRSRAFVNDSPATLPTLEAVSDILIDIHSQHKNMLLAQSEFQLSVLDRIADNEETLQQYHHAYAAYRKALRNFADTRDAIEKAKEDEDYLEYQLSEIDKVAPLPDEDSELAERRAEMEVATARSKQLIDAADALVWADANAMQLISKAASSLKQAAEVSADYADLSARLEALKVELGDISDSVAAEAADARDESQDLEEIDFRLSRLQTMMHRHKVQSANELIAVRNSIADTLARVADADEVLAALESEARSLKRKAFELASKLSQRRQKAANILADELCRRAMPLGMANLRVDIRVSQGKLNPDGHDTVEWLFAFNKNQELRPVGSTASGGEISRVMLALKAVLAEYMSLPTIIFDEIDTGVSGDVAARMGALMAQIGQRMQVITITHLPPVAACGTRHYKVAKHDVDDATETSISLLDYYGRVAELALMLSGNPHDPASIATAHSLLNQNNGSK